jgi:hypothetical protein
MEGRLLLFSSGSSAVEIYEQFFKSNAMQRGSAQDAQREGFSVASLRQGLPEDAACGGLLPAPSTIAG